MKQFFICLVILLVPIVVIAETLFLKDGTSIDTNYYWEEGNNKIGYFEDGDSKYIKRNLIDWDKSKGRSTLTKKSKDVLEKPIEKKTYVSANTLVGQIYLYPKSMDIIHKYGNPETLSGTNNDRWIAYFPKGDFTILTNKKTNRIIRAINGKGLW